MNNGEYLIAMGARIRAIRKAKKVTLRQLHNSGCIDRVALSRLELGKKNTHTLSLKTIADVLKVDVKDFL